MQSADIKQAAHQLIDQLDHLTWTKLAYQATLKASIEQGLKEAEAGQLTSQDDIVDPSRSRGQTRLISD